MKKIIESIKKIRILEIITLLLFVGSIGVGVVYRENVLLFFRGDETVGNRISQNELLRYAFFFVMFVMMICALVLRRKQQFTKLKGFPAQLIGTLVVVMIFTTLANLSFLGAITSLAEESYDVNVLGVFGFGLIIAVMGLMLKYYEVLDKLSTLEDLLRVESETVWSNIKYFVLALVIGISIMGLNRLSGGPIDYYTSGTALGAIVISSYVSTIGSYHIAVLLDKLIQLLQRK